MKKERRWRVSAYAMGVTKISAKPLVHKASRERINAENNFFMLARCLGTKYEMVILHQGKATGAKQ